MCPVAELPEHPAMMKTSIGGCCSGGAGMGSRESGEDALAPRTRAGGHKVIAAGSLGFSVRVDERRPPRAALAALDTDERGN